ncbi:hypothetical protein H6F67_00410 [Microcoleus sp. FACHB-1515]|uniref:hypothetical protein n=1 Tax=Cyanophyceae TaxID=3028117 RepID=UPI001686F29C|nr:hypothetical protein [Microcoleus sp. FACHB-1515]MBD2088338.1 hypothetical protein [Microcoleus sp. FACHB-1515]
MPQLPLFEDATQTHPPARSIARPKSPRSPRPKRPPQQPLLASTAATVPSIPAPIDPESDHDSLANRAAASDRSLPPAPTPAKELPPGRIDPTDPAFNYLKNCRLCGAPIEIGGLDHSLCSADCGWVVDLQWLARMEAHRRKRKEPEPQAATHTDRGDSEALDLFSNNLDRDTSDMDGGVA